MDPPFSPSSASAAALRAAATASSSISGSGSGSGSALTSPSFLNAPLTTITPTRLHAISESFAHLSILPCVLPFVDDSHYHHDLQSRIRADVKRITDDQAEYLNATRRFVQESADVDDSIQTANIINQKTLQTFRKANETAAALSAELSVLLEATADNAS